jgi:hypothetical protein
VGEGGPKGRAGLDGLKNTFDAKNAKIAKNAKKTDYSCAKRDPKLSALRAKV